MSPVSAGPSGRGGQDGPERPPRIWSYLLRAALPSEDAEVLLGDLAEEYTERVVPAMGARRARRWYRKMVLGTIRARWGRGRLARNPRRGGVVDGLSQDLVYGLRGLVRRPGLTAAVVATLAVTMGATISMYAVVHAVLIEPLPYPEASGIVSLFQGSAERPDARGKVSIPNFQDWRARSTTVSTMATVRSASFILTGRGDPRPVHGALISDRFFQVFRELPTLGRGIEATEAVPGGPDVVVVSDRFWRTVLEGRPDVLGAPVDLDGTTHHVVGVAPPGFDYPDGADVWVGERIDVAGCGRNCVNNLVVGRLASGSGIDAARSEFDAIARSMADEYRLRGYQVNVVPLHEVVVGDVRGPLRLLLGAVGLVLLIGCANIAGLLVARGQYRVAELAVRRAVGAGRLRIVRQLIVEAGVLGAAGGAVGLGLAALTLPAVRRSASLAIPRLETATVDGSVLLFVVAALVGATLLFGLAPALALTRDDIVGRLRSGAARGSASHSRLRATLVTGQVALSVVLIVGATLLVRTVARIRDVPLGFEPDAIQVISLSVPEGEEPTAEGVIRLHRAFLERLRDEPAVVAVGGAFGAPLSDIDVASGLRVDGWTGSEGPPSAGVRTVTPGYFTTLGIALRSGRLPEAGDRVGQARVAWVNETAARTYWSDGADPLGRTLDLSASVGLPEREPRTVVGVVADTRFGGPRQDVPPEVYVPEGQNGARTLEYFVRLRQGGGVSSVPGLARMIVRDLRPSLAVESSGSLLNRVEAADADTRLWTWLLGGFGALALGLAAMGMFGVVALEVARRRHEMGIRMAIGAPRERAVRFVLVLGLRPAVAGLALGVAAAALSRRLVAGLLFGVGPADPVSWVAAVALLLAVVAAAALLPALRVASIPPAEVLRPE